MAGLMESYLVPIFVGVAMCGFFAWLCYCIYYIIARILKIGNILTTYGLKKKYKNGIEYSDEVLNFCRYAVQNKWKFRDIRIITKKNPKRDEILYTYLMMKKLEKENKLETKKSNKLQDFEKLLK